MAAKCPQKKDVSSIKNIGSALNLFERTLTVNGHKVKGLIDSGSGCTLLRNSIAVKYNMDIETSPSVILQGFAGQTVASERSTSCNVKIMNAEARVNHFE